MSYNVLLCDFRQFFCNLIDYACNIIGEIRVQTEEICSMYCPKPCSLVTLLGLLYKENRGQIPHPSLVTIELSKKICSMYRLLMLILV